MKRGSVVWVNLSDAHPPEMGKTRPAVVLSNTTLNARLGTVVVVPLSTQAGEIWPLRIKVAAGGRKACLSGCVTMLLRECLSTGFPGNFPLKRWLTNLR